MDTTMRPALRKNFNNGKTEQNQPEREVTKERAVLCRHKRTCAQEEHGYAPHYLCLTGSGGENDSVVRLMLLRGGRCRRVFVLGANLWLGWRWGGNN